MAFHCWKPYVQQNQHAQSCQTHQVLGVAGQLLIPTGSWLQDTRSHSIAFLELFPILVAGIVWGKQWENCHVKVLCDNQEVVEVIQSRYSRDDNLMHLLRCLFFCGS